MGQKCIWTLDVDPTGLEGLNAGRGVHDLLVGDVFAIYTMDEGGLDLERRGNALRVAKQGVAERS
jgi:hypothetical protein